MLAHPLCRTTGGRDFCLLGSPLGAAPDHPAVAPVFQLRPACQQVYNLFHPADPSASRLEPLLEHRFHALAPFSVPRYQRYPLGDGCSALLGEPRRTGGGTDVTPLWPRVSVSSGQDECQFLSVCSLPVCSSGDHAETPAVGPGGPPWPGPVWGRLPGDQHPCPRAPAWPGLRGVCVTPLPHVCSGCFPGAPPPSVGHPLSLHTSPGPGGGGGEGAPVPTL